jgi:hypothetical protein
MDKKCNLYINMVKLISDIYKKNKDYNKTLEFVKFMNVDEELMDEWKKIIKYIEKLYISYDNKNKEFNKYNGKLRIKNGIDNSYNYLINIYNIIYKDYNVDIELMLLLIIPSISIIMKNKNGKEIEIIDFKIGSEFNNRILNLVNTEDFLDEKCAICLEKINKYIIISNCCCIKTCLRCFNLINGKCAICKKENPIIIMI